MQSAKRIFVTGDVTLDWNLARLHRSIGKIQRWGYDDCTRASSQPGGAALLGNIIDAISKDLKVNQGVDYSTIQPEFFHTPIEPIDNRFHHSYALWSLFDKMTWRVEEYLGLDRCTDIELSYLDEIFLPGDGFTQDDIVVLDDADLGFRNHHEALRKHLQPGDNAPRILLKMSQPIAQGPLWEYLLENFADRLIVITTVNDLRRTEVQISEGLSWERTAQDVVWELVHNPQVNGLARCAAVVVSFDAAGAVVLHRNPITNDTPDESIAMQRHLLFDPKVVEGMWEQAHPGGMIGYTTCLIAGIARQFMIASDQPDLLGGIHTGLAALRDLHSFGYENKGSEGKPELEFPFERIVRKLAEEPDTFAMADIQDPVRFLIPGSDALESAPEGGFWTILQDRYRDNLEQISEQIVLEGPEDTIKEVPLGIFGALLTVDRQEIESFRSIHSLVGEYLSQERPKRPLSFAVFGAPGSGKSFGITQVAKSLAPGKISTLEFNISQFESPEKLIDALHQVRDVGLSGQIPLVFWDEFDTPSGEIPLGWLRYFLAPMQDGAFREDQIVHPIGRAVFVFAGGTSARMQDFGKDLEPKTYRSSKVPDFISRLKGFVNILGPNSQGKAESDPYYIIRRAILLRSIFQRNASHLFEKRAGKKRLNIDRGVLRAFLKISEYKHGIRSMESIGDMSQLAGKKAFERSSLPSEAQLDLHVNGQEFLSIVQQLDLSGELLERLATAAHQVFCEQMRAQGYEYGELTDDEEKKHSSLVPYQELSQDEKDQNRDLVRDIAMKLAGTGYVMIPARSDEPAFEFPGAHLEHLSEQEHERWMGLKIQSGWKHAPETDKEKHLHAALVAWENLSEADKEKDRIMVRQIPDILAQAGYTIVRLRD
ncbi:MAG: RyR domain-containing protein [Anaerolineales bacterium]